jgi:hypothetical protein
MFHFVARHLRCNTSLREEKRFSVGSVPKNYRRFQITEDSEYVRVEEGSTTSTVTLRIVKGNENRSLISETVKYGPETQGTLIPERIC